MAPLDRLPETHLTYYLAAKNGLAYATANWEFVKRVLLLDLSLPPGSTIEEDGSITLPAKEEVGRDE